MSLSMRIPGISAALLLIPFAHAQDAPAEHHHAQGAEATQSEREHVPPAPPATEVPHDMPYRAMARMMEMDDAAPIGKVLLDRLEWSHANDRSVFSWDGEAWYGTDSNKLWLKTEGSRSRNETRDARIEALWDRVFSRWWNLQAGVRHDFGDGPSRDWLAAGVEGLAPYFVKIEATAYVGESGRTAARLKAQHDMLITQRLILQPELEFNLYGKSDLARGVGAGLADAQLALHLRYEIRREFAPYVGLVWVHRAGRTADLARAAGEDPSDVQFAAGVRVWF